MTTVPKPHQNGTELLQTSIIEHTHAPSLANHTVQYPHTFFKTYSIRYEFLVSPAGFYGGPQPESYTFQTKNYVPQRNLTHRVKVLSEHEIDTADNTAT